MGAVGSFTAHSFSLSLHDAEIVVYTAAVGSALNYALITWANTGLDASVVSAYGVLQPVFTAILAYAAFREVPTVGEIAGGAPCIVGLLLAAPPARSSEPLHMEPADASLDSATAKP